MNYFWVRIFDYKYQSESDSLEPDEKGTLLDEYYLTGETLSREDCKKQIVSRSGISRFAKPRKKDGIYAIVMESEKYWYDRFTVTVDTCCFNCREHIQGKEKDFPHIEYEGKKYYFCSYDCRRETEIKLHAPEGEWQEREGYDKNGGIYGYIYHIYNRKTNMHYVGQTLYMPFFRWQEHAKAKLKGDICDLVFETITKVEYKDQDYLNSIEAWWIQKFIEDYGREHVMNLVVPHITMSSLIKDYDRMIQGQCRFETSENKKAMVV